MSNTIPTAEEFLMENYPLNYEELPYTIDEHLKEFTRMHVKAALEAAAQKAKTETLPNNVWFRVVNKDSILNAYPEELIK